MSEEFFSNYPKIQYDLYRNGSSVELTDICRAAIINSELVADDATNYTYYDIFDGDRPDTVSYKIYGTVDHYWTFFLINDHLRSGLNAQWPLSYSDFTKYINKKYAQYSCISFIPQENIDNKGILDFSIVPLDDKYLPYLRLTSSTNTGSKIANIERYDSARQQLIVYDIHGMQDSNRYEIIRDSFIKDSGNFVNPSYRLFWQLPDKNIVGDKEYTNSLKLKTEWINRLYDYLKQPKVDYVGWKNHIEYGQTQEQYIFSKYFVAASDIFRWTNYAEAAHSYYSTDYETTISAYDILKTENVVYPNYVSFNDYETSLNDKKTSIKIIRPEYINDFIKAYFETLTA